MNTVTVEAAVTIIKETAKVRPEVRHISKMTIGQAVRQGDCYIVRISMTHKPGMPRKDFQLAPGTSRGSRHIATGEKIEVFEASAIPRRSGINSRALLGPVMVAKSRCLVTHPEHAHVDLPPGAYQILYQMDMQTQERVQD